MTDTMVLYEANELGVLYPDYHGSIDLVHTFLDEVESYILQLIKNPTVIEEGLDEKIHKFKSDISKEYKPHEIDIHHITTTLRQVRKDRDEIDRLTGKFSSLKNKIAFGGNYYRAILNRPHVYSKEPDPEKYTTINCNIREVNRAMDWVEKVLIDLYQYTSHDLDILKYVNRVYAKKHIYESIDPATYELTEEEMYVIGDKPKEIYQWMHKHLHYDSDDHNWRLRTPRQTVDDKKGNCHDQALLGCYLLSNIGCISGFLFFIQFDENSNQGGKTHTLTWYKDPHDDYNIYWFENAWDSQAGIHGPYKSFYDLRYAVFYAYAKDDTMNENKFDGLMFSRMMPYHRSSMEKKVGMSLGEYVQSMNIQDDHKFYLFNTKKSEKIQESFDWMDEFMNNPTFRESVSDNSLEGSFPMMEADNDSDDQPPELPSDDQIEEEQKEENPDDESKETETSEEEPAEEDQSDEKDSSEEDQPPEEEVTEEPPKEEPKKPVSMPKKVDAAEENKNGIRRKKLYIAFIEWCKQFNPKNTFGSIFDKDAFHVTYPFVPHEMRYFYRLANPLLCVLPGKLTFFQVAELKKLNSKNPHMDQVLIFAATEKDLRVFNIEDKKVYLATQEDNEEVKLGIVLGDTFDLYIQNMIKQGDILNGPIESDQPTEEES